MLINEFEKQSDHPCDNDKSRFGTYLTKNKVWKRAIHKLDSGNASAYLRSWT